MAAALAEVQACISCPSTSPDSAVGEVVREGLGRIPKRLPPWLFYDEAGSLLFEQITEVPEYYLARIERGIFEAYAAEMIVAAADEKRLRVVELGAGSADKTRLLLAAAAAHQGAVAYCPVDVSATALEAARERLERELPAVMVEPEVADYTHGLRLEACADDERRLVLFIGSSIGNFDRDEAVRLLQGLGAALEPGDGLLLGVDLAPCSSSSDGKSEGALIAAYDDSAGVTARFNGNMLDRLNRELGAAFDLETFRHLIRWNREDSRIEMHLESLQEQTVRIESVGLEVDFARGETIHTENSYKYREGEAEALLRAAGFETERRWSDAGGWFAVYLAKRI